MSDANIIFARDEQGQLHRAKAGTPLPSGWKLAGPGSEPKFTKPTAPPKPFAEPGFGAGFKAGVNPLHSVPDKMPYPGSMGTMGNMAADAVNLREIANRGMTGDISGAIGQGVGTAAQLFGPEALKAGSKALHNAGMAARTAKEIPMLGKVAPRARDTARALGGGIDVARGAERFVAPLRDALDLKFQAVHKALEGKAFGLPDAAMRELQALKKSEIPQAVRFAQKYLRRSALEYGEARKFVEHDAYNVVRQLARNGAEDLGEHVLKFREAVEAGIEGLAKAEKVDALRGEYKQVYGQVQALRNAIVGLGKTEPSTAKKIAGATAGSIVGGVAGHPLAGGYVGLRSVGGKTIRMSAEVLEAGKKLAAKLGVPFEELLGKSKSGKVIAGATGHTAANIYQRLGPMWRSLTSMVSDNPPAPMP